MLVFVVALGAAACAYVLPASWRAFRADPDDAAPAVTRALGSMNVTIQHFDQARRQIVSSWVSSPRGIARSRERFVVTWERDPKEKQLTVYVRHEAQDQETDNEGGVPRWGSVYHDSGREALLLDRVQKELSGGDLDAPVAPSEEN